MTNDEAVDLFWKQARIEAKVNRLEVVVGPNVHGTMPPPVWSTSADPVTATADVDRLLTEGTLTQVVEVAELQQADQSPAEVGDLAIVLDGDERPRALVRTAGVEQATNHPDLPEAGGDVIVERLELLYPRRRKTRARTTR